MEDIIIIICLFVCLIRTILSLFPLSYSFQEESEDILAGLGMFLLHATAYDGRGQAAAP